MEYGKESLMEIHHRRNPAINIVFYSTQMRKKFLKKSETFFRIFVWSSVSRTVPKNKKESPLGVFEDPFSCNIAKNRMGDPLETKKLRKSLTKTK